MYKAILEIEHKGCWGSEISLKFPEHEFSSVDCRWVKKGVAHILHASGNTEDFNKIIKYLKSKKDVLSTEVLSKTDQDIYIRTITEHDTKHPKFSYIFFKNGCFPIAPTKFKDKYEVWTLGTANRKNITKVYEILKKKKDIPELKIKHIKEEPIQPKLTTKQRETLIYAKYYGYYEWPRKMSATEIAKMVNIPKTVFLSHLRKAENKIIKTSI